MDTTELIAPSAWASYLINNDDSGLDPEDKAQADAWIERRGLGVPVSCEDAGFHWTHDAQAECDLGADCQVYTFLTESPRRELARGIVEELNKDAQADHPVLTYDDDKEKGMKRG